MGQYPCFKRSGQCISIFGWAHQNGPKWLSWVYAVSVWASLTFKVCGLSAIFQVHWPMGLHISIWASTPTSSSLASAYLYLDVRIKWTKIVIVTHISDWDSSAFTKINFTCESHIYLPIRGDCTLPPPV